MESFPNFKERGNSEQERLEGLKKSFISLCEQMKGHVESGEYDALVSDDTGGRIPTLFFMEVLKLVKPEHSFKTLFLASGKNYKPENEEQQKRLEGYLKRGLGDSKKVLIITQYIHNGGTVARLTNDLRNIGVEHIDITSIYANASSEEIIDSTKCDHLFLDDIRDKRQFGFTENNNVLSGVSKMKGYDPLPMSLESAIETGQIKRSELLTTEETNMVIGIKEYDSFNTRKSKIHSGEEKIDELDTVPLSEEEIRTIQENADKTVEHIKTLAKEVVSEVWGIKK
jgi:hypothetical protein